MKASSDKEKCDRGVRTKEVALIFSTLFGGAAVAPFIEIVTDKNISDLCTWVSSVGFLFLCYGFIYWYSFFNDPNLHMKIEQVVSVQNNLIRYIIIGIAILAIGYIIPSSNKSQTVSSSNHNSPILTYDNVPPIEDKNKD